MVFDYLEDGQEEIINYPKFSDQGPILFSLDFHDQFHEMGQDKLLEFTSN